MAIAQNRTRAEDIPVQLQAFQIKDEAQGYAGEARGGGVVGG